MFVRLLIWALLGFLAYTIFQAVRRALTAPRRTPPEKTTHGEEMVKDPECGTYLPKSDAHSALVDGQTVYFCSPECRSAFQQKKQA